MAGEVQAAADIMKVLFGQKQTGAAAPAFQPGASTGVGGMGGFQPSFNSALGGLLSESLMNNTLEGIDKLKTGTPPIMDTTSDELGPTDIPGGFKGLDNFGPQPFQPPGIPSGFKGLDPVQESLKEQSLADIDDKTLESEQGFGYMLKNLLGGIDKGLQSPSQVIGLGLLNRYGGNSPALPLAGLLGMGLLNRKR